MTGHLLATLSAKPRSQLAVSAIRARPLIAEAAVQVESVVGDGISGRPPRQPDLPALWRRLDAAERSGNYSALTSRDWRDSPWCFWRVEGQAIPLSKRPTFAASYGRWIEQRQRKGDYRRLVQAWLLHFNRESPPKPAATLITNACRAWPEWLWAQRHANYEMFDVEKGPSNVAGHVLNEARPVRQVLRELGIGEWLQAGGYAEAAFAAVLDELPRRLRLSVSEARGQELVQRMLEWAGSSGGDLQFPKLRAAIAESLLLPWIQSAPPKPIERTITAFLLKVFRDPRMEPTRWNGVRESAVNVLKRWLTGATLEAFVRLIERVAEEGHWKYRKAFWMAYYRTGHVLDAWVVLGPEAERLSRGIDALKGQSSELKKPPLSNHSVLLLRIGNLVIADWSHNGKCRIWREGDRQAPLLYRRGYEASDLRVGAKFEITHHSSSTGGWQGKIHDQIRDLTGIRLPSSSYRP